jgi:cephalosporin hydroxylase
MQKSPFDLALYMKLLWDLKPRTVIEIGTQHGGSALWFADQLKAFGLDGHVHSVDITPPLDLSHPGVTFHQADARQIGLLFGPELVASLPRPLLLVEDSDHHSLTCQSILKHFEPLMRPGEYIVIEDGIVDHLPSVYGLFDGGPSAAIDSFLAQCGQRWMVDRGLCDFFGYNVTWNTNGFLLKLRD